jgi:tetratricopeptide (TPR) repeat protein
VSVRTWRRAAVSGAVLLGTAAALLAVGTVVAVPTGDAGPAVPTVGRAASLSEGIVGLQRELERLPANDSAWAQLGAAYVEQARRTADPTLYARADDAFARSLALRPQDNDAALTGQASLAAARHQFAEALALTDRALLVNSHGATAYAVRTDALVELGRYDEARAALSRMLELRPGLDAFSRASYVLELSGDVDGARAALERALQAATSPADEAFVHHLLGELAWNTGDVPAARSAYEAGVAADPSAFAPRAGRAKVLAAEGDVEAAVAEYRTVVAAMPQPEYLVQLGDLLEATGQPDRAQEQYDVVRAIQRLFAANGQDVDAELAVFDADHGSAAEALASAQAVHRAAPDAIFAQDALAWALHAAGRSAEALPLARAAVRTGLPQPVLHYHLGVVEAAVGERDAARTSLQRALALNPAFSPLHAPRARDLLSELG